LPTVLKACIVLEGMIVYYTNISAVN